jgi:hypothetical protein
MPYVLLHNTVIVKYVKAYYKLLIISTQQNQANNVYDTI